MRKLLLITSFVLLFIMAAAACTPVLKAAYNEIDVLTDVTPPFIEGAYSEPIDAETYTKLTGLNIIKGLPERFRDDRINHSVYYDKDEKIINISTYFGDGSIPLGVYLDSQELWSPLGYPPENYWYRGENGGKGKLTNVAGTDVEFICYSDSKAEYKLGHDLYIARFTLNKINVCIVEKGKPGDAAVKSEFEKYVAAVIGNSKK